jgi:hypothetical protein
MNTVQSMILNWATENGKKPSLYLTHLDTLCIFNSYSGSGQIAKTESITIPLGLLGSSSVLWQAVQGRMHVNRHA